MAEANDNSTRDWLGAFAVFVLTALCYLRSLHHQLLAWDDDRIVAGDPFLQRVSLEGLINFFTTASSEAYQPLHRLSYWLDVPWFGLSGTALHATNIVLWSAGASVCFLLLRAARVSLWAAGLATLWFAVHPVQVEAVSWVTGRKDCVALLFGASATLLFVRERRVLATLLYVCAVLGKTSCLPLPLAFVLIDMARGRGLKSALRQQVLALCTMIGLGGLVVMLWSTHEMVRPDSMSRVLLVLATLGNYARLVVVPAQLSALYPIWKTPGDVGAEAWFGLIGLVVLAAVFLKRREYTWLFALAAFCIMLLPVSNIVPLYFQRADRYLSLPLLPIAFAIGHTVDRLAVALKPTFLGAIVLGGWSLALAFVCNVQQTAWANDTALWKAATHAQPDAFYAWLKLGHAERDAGHYDESIVAYEGAIQAQPSLVLGYAALFYAVVHHEVRDPKKADGLALQFQQALSDPARMDELASTLIELDARRSAVLALKQIFAHPNVSEAAKQAIRTRAQTSFHSWLPRAMEIALASSHPATEAF